VSSPFSFLGIGVPPGDLLATPRHEGVEQEGALKRRQPLQADALVALQMGLRQRLRACLFIDSSDSEDAMSPSISRRSSLDVGSSSSSSLDGSSVFGGRKRGQDELSPAGPTDSLILRYVLNMQTHGSRPRGLQHREVQQHCAPRIPSLLAEKEWSAEAIKSYDKAFASTWVSEEHVLVGTKCNKLLEVDVKTGATQEVPVSLRKASTSVAPSSQLQMEDSSKCGIHSVAVSPTGEYVAVGGANPRHCAVLKTNRRLRSCPQTCLEPPKYSHVQTMTVSFAAMLNRRAAFSSVRSVVINVFALFSHATPHTD